MNYRSTKTFGHDVGLSACFRQWRAVGSHCRHLHGYALAIRLEFAADELDARNWVVDFGNFKFFKKWLEDTFDHALLIAEDDPYKDELCALAGLDLVRPVVVENVGCEAFAKLIYDYAARWLEANGYAPRVGLVSVEVREHGANSAIYTRTKF